jgi:hypothetical protein
LGEVKERYNMTRVFMSLAVLEYCEGMAELVRELCERPAITGVEPRSRRELFPARKDLPAFRLDGLLKPPGVEALEPYLFPAGDRAESIVYIATSGKYGIINVYVTLEDERGRQIESGFALRDQVEPDDWFYFPSASLRSGATVTVRAIAMDPLGGVRSRDENVTV